MYRRSSNRPVGSLLSTMCRPDPILSTVRVRSGSTVTPSHPSTNTVTAHWLVLRTTTSHSPSQAWWRHPATASSSSGHTASARRGRLLMASIYRPPPGVATRPLPQGQVLRAIAAGPRPSSGMAHPGSRLERDEIGADGAAPDAQQGHGDRQGEAPGTGAAGVHVEHAAAFDDGGNVGVAADHRREAGGGGVEVEPGEVVQDVEADGADIGHGGFGKAARPRLHVHVPAHRNHRRDAPQLPQNGG